MRGETDSLRTWLAGQLGMDGKDARFDALWQYLEDKHYAGEALKGELTHEELLDEARKQVALSYALAGQEKPPGRQANHAPVRPVELTDYERECAKVLSVYLAKQAAFRPEVCEFRKERLGGPSLLTPEEASDFLRNELLDEGEDEDLALNANLETVIAVSIGPPPNVPGDELLPTHQTGYIFGYESMFGSGGLMALTQLSRRLADLYPWSPEDALWWLLTGETPEISPVTLTYRPDHNTFVLTFLPVISEETFRRAYRQAQDHVRHGGDNRPLEEKTLAVLQFVSEQRSLQEGEESTWAELTRRWNGLYPEWSFGTYSGLRRAYQRAATTLAPYHYLREKRR